MLGGGQSFLVTGAAGTGKTVVRDVIAAKVPCVVLGPTGMSVADSGGMTVARYLKATKKTSGHARRLARSMTVPPSVPHFTVIIEEATMVGTADWLALDLGLRTHLRSQKPFGGVRVVLFGDFCQLAGPGVTCPLTATAPFAALEKAGLAVIVLTEQMRQDPNERAFAALLADCRAGRLGEESAALLRAQSLRTPPADALRLYATRREAESWNAAQLKKIDAPTVNAGGVRLKVGAPVTVTANVYAGGKIKLANGTCGTVRAATPLAVTIEVNGRAHTLPTPPPLALAYALTIHKAQGQTYDRVVVVGTRIFAAGQAYTALSRARSLAGVYCVDLLPEDFEHPLDPRVARFVDGHALR
jgi:hypothetical protein